MNSAFNFNEIDQDIRDKIVFFRKTLDSVIISSSGVKEDYAKALVVYVKNIADDLLALDENYFVREKANLWIEIATINDLYQASISLRQDISLKLNQGLDLDKSINDQNLFVDWACNNLSRSINTLKFLLDIAHNKYNFR